MTEATRRKLLLAGSGVLLTAPFLPLVAPMLGSTSFGSRLSGRMAGQGANPGSAFPGCRFGPENNAYIYSGATLGGRQLGANFGGLGPSLFRAIQLPANYGNIPATGDHWLLLFFRTPAYGSASTRSETLLGVRGAGVKGGANSGAIYFNTLSQSIGSTTGQDISSSSGLIQCQRLNGAYALWPQAVLGAANGIVLLPDTDYALFFGIHGTSGVDRGQMTLVSLADTSIQTAQSPLALSASRATSKAMFDQIGALGSAGPLTDAQGFGGGVGDFAVWTAPFPTTAQARSIATGATAVSDVTSALGSGSLVYWNTLNAARMINGAIPAEVGPPALVVGANVVPCAPIRKSPLLTLNRLGAHFVFPLAAGANMGNVWFEGVAPAGATVTCQLNYLDGAQSSTVQATADASGAYAVAIRSSGGRPFFRQATLSGQSAGMVLDGDIMDVGIVIPMLGQSEVNVLNTWSGSVSNGVSDGGANNAGHDMAMPGSYSGPWASWIDTIYINNGGVGIRRTRGMAARPQIMLGNGMPGDGTVQACEQLMQQTGYSVMLVLLTRSGTPMDAMIVDGQTFTLSPTFTGAGTSASPLVATLAVTTSALSAKFGYANFAPTKALINGVAPGSLRLTFQNKGQAVTLTDSFPGYSGAADCRGTLVGAADITGTINYLTGSISLVFASSPSISAVSATWTVKQETQETTYLSKTANINGWGVRESVDIVGKAGLRFGWTFSWHWWITSNISDASSIAAGAAMLSIRTALLNEMMKGGSHFTGYIAPGLRLDAGCANPKIVIGTKGREVNGVAVTKLNNIDYARQAQASICPTGANALDFTFGGGWYYDNSVDVLPASPHEDHSDQGARRIGRRMATDWLAAFQNDRTINRGPEWGAPTFSGNVCTVPVAYIGSGLSLATPGDPSSLDEWYVGTATTLGTPVDNAGFATAAIRDDGLAVVITKASGNWLGSEVIRYVVGAPGTGLAAPASLLYDNRGGFGGFEPGLLAAPKFA